MFTDPQRQRKSDPGRPELCNVHTFHQLYSLPEMVAEIEPACRSAAIGCTECKLRLADAVAEGMRPIHERRAHYLAHPEEVRAIIEDGNVRAAGIAKATLTEVREALKISHEL
jgi:tryptophanyl-tRNA synthetase